MSDIAAHQLLRKCCICIAADTATANTAFVLQLPLKFCICIVVGTATVNIVSTLQPFPTVVATASAMENHPKLLNWCSLWCILLLDLWLLLVSALTIWSLCIAANLYSMPTSLLPTLAMCFSVFGIPSHCNYHSDTPLHQLTLVHPATFDMGSRSYVLIQEVDSSRILPICGSFELQN